MTTYMRPTTLEISHESGDGAWFTSSPGGGPPRIIEDWFSPATSPYFTLSDIVGSWGPTSDGPDHAICGSISGGSGQGDSLDDDVPTRTEISPDGLKRSVPTVRPAAGRNSARSGRRGKRGSNIVVRAFLPKESKFFTDSTLGGAGARMHTRDTADRTTDFATVKDIAGGAAYDPEELLRPLVVNRHRRVEAAENMLNVLLLDTDRNMGDEFNPCVGGKMSYIRDVVARLRLKFPDARGDDRAERIVILRAIALELGKHEGLRFTDMARWCKTIYALVVTPSSSDIVAAQMLNTGTRALRLAEEAEAYLKPTWWGWFVGRNSAMAARLGVRASR